MSTSDIRGIIPPLVTPFREDGSIDEQALRADVRYVVEKTQVHGIAVCGSTGEGHTLNTEETRRIVGAAVEEVRGRVPVIAAIIADSTAAAVERAQAVADLQVAALQVTPVHYLFRPDDDSMRRHFATIADRSGVPVIIYNVVPWAYLSPALLARILRDEQGVIGVKQSASDMKTLADLLLLVKEAGIAERVRILSAVDALLYSSFCLGADGAVAAILTAVPEWCMAQWKAVQQGEHATALLWHQNLLRLWNVLDAPNLPANVRAAMRKAGREGGLPRLPMPPSSAQQEKLIHEALRKAEETILTMECASGNA